MLSKVALLSAPIAPFYMDQLWNDLTGAECIHFENMPQVCEELIDKDLEERMELAQKATSMVLALRRKVNIKVRQPLSKLIVPVLSDKVLDQLEKVKELILTEVNVKEAEFISDTTGIITKKIKPNFRTLGKKYGAQMKGIAAAFGQFDQKTIAAIEAAGTYSLDVAGISVTLEPGDYEISSEDMPGWLVATEGQLTIALDIEVSDKLRHEGTARELINRIQNIRKDSDFEVTDKVDVVIFADEAAYGEISAALDEYKTYLASQTLALSVGLEDIAQADEKAVDVEWDEAQVKIKVTR